MSDSERKPYGEGTTLTPDGLIPYRDSPTFRGPDLGGVEFLVRGDCECGWRCACPEGWTWPNCPNCNKIVKPNRDPGPTLAYVAILGEEQHVVALVRGWTR